ncbi:hypothetical protein M527_06580 [Sphingobium indicum IP26]|uniref:Uncharacterized protein n=1 Tax=Sphingobium indicum F2 TaxID=1450518 RepID=A0A8E0WTQ4_9SPHN|nr:hypothetical protein [Sphingobium indicum]EPR09789.1 hypothetical protein M527_06580 [Sphingobium indicum IP26]KER37263.1 hypothetical protein AL00_06205 [Sphingobium indicum F2]
MDQQTQKLLEDLYTGAVATGLAGISVGILLANRLAESGLITPADIDAIAHGVTAPFEEMPDNPFAQQALAAIQSKLDPELARIREASRRAGKGSQP